MCGIAAVWGESAPDLAHRIAERMTHRGPDGQGSLLLQGPPVALAHRRLAIIDPAHGRQPLESAATNAALVANGMIYNDLALREALHDAPFRTSSDSESILQHCLRRGPAGVADLDGMFAFAMACDDRVLAARDPIGIKPLYVGRRGETFCFSSEIKPLLPEVDEIHEFPPGHVFDSAVGLRRFYVLPEATDYLRKPAAAIAAIRRTLTHAVEKRLRSDVPLGVFLSGGLDSSLIAAIASQYQPGLKTFAVGLAGSPDLEAARTVAEYLGTDHHEAILTAADVTRDLPEILHRLESFDRDLVRSAVPCYYVSRLAAEHVKVVLTGEGADEIFAGYTYHKSYDDTDALQAELRRSILSMHDINLQRVDRMTMAHGLEARVPFLDRDMLELAFRIPANLKLPPDNGIEKWILRKTFEDLLPSDIVWRNKQQFDQGSGIADLLQSLTSGAPAPASDGLPNPARDPEEAMYRTQLIDQLNEPEKLLDLVAHWESDERVDDEAGRDRVSVTAINTPLNDGAVADVALDDFSALYDLPSPRPYFQRMAKLHYRGPEAAAGIYRWCIDALRQLHDVTELTVLDLCAGYGINGALMRLDKTLDELYLHYSDTRAHDRSGAFFDRLALQGRCNNDALNIVGVDIAAQALAYGAAAGFMTEGYAVNLESDPLPSRLRETIASCSLITITGGFSFIGAATFDKILTNLPDSAGKPWIAGFPLLHTNLESIIDVLHAHGYVIQQGLQYRFLQRKFASDHERRSERTALTRAGIKTTVEDYFESRLLFAQPPGTPPLPEEVLERDTIGASKEKATEDSQRRAS